MTTPAAASDRVEAAWARAPVSPWSRYGDDEWRLDIPTPGRRADQTRVRWSFPTPIGSRIAPAEQAALSRAARQFLWSMATDPPAGRRRLSPTSLHTRAQNLRTIIEWMAREGVAAFRDLDPAAVSRLRAWLLTRSGRGKRASLAPSTVVSYLTPLKDLYRQRAQAGRRPAGRSLALRDHL